jgi:hypothetical protein
LPKADKWPLIGEAKRARPNLAAVVVVWRMMWVVSMKKIQTLVWRIVAPE